MRKIESLLNEYGESHTNRINIGIHAIAVPAIYFVTIALLWSLSTPKLLDYFGVTWAHIILLPTLYYYFKLSGPIGAAMTLLSIVSFLGIQLLELADIVVWQFSLVLFIVMWILQFIGHHIEGKKPSFIKDLQFLLVGPAWWWGHWLKRLNINY
ncbi:DUF962 domain-containing protein [Paraglaciecola sp. 2405UD69-4]|uniref:Mpo1 family 2-hydroxy fatty acid dioxygenase n=1 Tax=Paraglaciecola sp. 2405UD69-4 TaxID=3391836 RepID=UPI0039C96008